MTYRDVGDREAHKGGVYICMGLIHFVGQQQLTPHCKTIILKLKKKVLTLAITAD